MGIYRYERRLWLAIEREHGIKKAKGILAEKRKRLLEYAEESRLPERVLLGGYRYLFDRSS